MRFYLFFYVVLCYPYHKNFTLTTTLSLSFSLHTILFLNLRNTPITVNICIHKPHKPNIQLHTYIHLHTLTYSFTLILIIKHILSKSLATYQASFNVTVRPKIKGMYEATRAKIKYNPSTIVMEGQLAYLLYFWDYCCDSSFFMCILLFMV